MEKIFKKGASAYLFQFHQIEVQYSKQGDSRWSKIQEFIQRHKKVFQDLPMELPLEKRIEHIIEVNPGSSLVKVKP